MQTEFIYQSHRMAPSLGAHADAGELSEAQLVAEAKEGSFTAFERLVDQYEARIFRLAQSIARNHEDAEEITQNAFVQAFRNLARFRGDSRFYTWLVRITINEGLMKTRRRRLDEISIDDLMEKEDSVQPREFQDWGPTPEQDYSQLELQGILAANIGQLSPGYRAVFQLRDVEGLTTEETAQALNLTLATVKTRLRRARLQLRESLSRCFTPTKMHRATSFGMILLVLFCLISVIPASAQTPANAASGSSNGFNLFSRPYLLGDWGGERSKLEDRGVKFNFYYVADLLANPTGGERQSETGWGRIRGTVDMDLGKLVGAKGLTFHATGVWQFGVNLGANIGSIANPSGLVSAHTTRLDSWWLQQSLFSGKLFLRAGQFAGLDFYGVQEYGSSYVMEPLDYALGNLFGTTFESFDPAATPAAEIRFVPTPNIYVKSAVLSGNRNPYVQDATGFHFKIANSPVFVYEAGYLVDPSGPNASEKTYPGIYKFGAAYNDGKFFDPISNTSSHGNYLIYFMANQAVYRASPGSNRGLDLDFGYDWSPSDVNRQNSQLTAGFRYNGLLPHRDQDSLAFGLVYSKISDQFSLAGTLQGLPALSSERAIELNYAFHATPCLLFQPVFQYYFNVGGNSQIPDAAVYGFRTMVTF